MITYNCNGHMAVIQYRIITNHIHYIRKPPEQTRFSLVLSIRVNGAHCRLSISFQDYADWTGIVSHYEHTTFLGLFNLAEMQLHNAIFGKIKNLIDGSIISLTT